MTKPHIICGISQALHEFPSIFKKTANPEKDLMLVINALATRIKMPFTVINAKGIVEFSSSAFVELLSLSSTNLKGLNIIDLFVPQERERLKNGFSCRKCIPGQASSFSLTGLTRDGRHISLYTTMSCIQTEAGHFLLTFEDITETQKEHDKIEKLENQAAIGTFTSGVAHEFNNVLAGIRGYAQLAKNDVKDSALILKAFQIIEQETVRGAELCKNLSLYSGNKKLSLEPVIIKDTIATAADLQSRYLLFDNIKLTMDIDEMPPVLADRYKLQQVLLNLIINARHAVMPKSQGTIHITANIINEEVCITVADNGVGIEPYNLSRIFDPFYTNKTASSKLSEGKSPVRGTGLGLTVCQTIIKQHGGSIDVTSQSGMGTSFTVRIPFRYAERRAAGKHMDMQKKLSEPASKKLSILVVDDDMPMREVIYRTLIQTSADVTLASNAEDCINAIEQNSYDLILLDYVLPEMNADRLLPVIREKNPSAKIVFISGWNASPLKKTALESQSDGWLDKPFNMETLVQKISSLF